MALVAHFDLEFHQMDVKTAFLLSLVDLLNGVGSGGGRVCSSGTGGSWILF